MTSTARPRRSSCKALVNGEPCGQPEAAHDDQAIRHYFSAVTPPSAFRHLVDQRSIELIEAEHGLLLADPFVFDYDL